MPLRPAPTMMTSKCSKAMALSTPVLCAVIAYPARNDKLSVAGEGVGAWCSEFFIQFVDFCVKSLIQRGFLRGQGLHGTALSVPGGDINNGACGGPARSRTLLSTYKYWRERFEGVADHSPPPPRHGRRTLSLRLCRPPMNTRPSVRASCCKFGFTLRRGAGEGSAS